MRRADRLFRLVQLMRGGRLTTADKLAEAMEVSPRTVYRDIADLQASGVPIEGEAGVGYVLDSGFDLPPLMFDRDEITALVAGARLIQAFGGLEMARAAEEALVKIQAVLPDDIKERTESVGIDAVSFGLSEEMRARIDRFEGAVQAHERLDIVYADEKGNASERVIRPLSLIFWGRVWTLIAWCELRTDFRTFRLDRIESFEANLGTFQPERGKTLRDFYRIIGFRQDSDNRAFPKEFFG